MKTWLRVILSLVANAALAGTVNAATISVSETLDDDPAVDNAFCSLREAILAANTDSAVDSCVAGSGADTITLPVGTYTLSLATSLIISSELTLNGADAKTTVVEGPPGSEGPAGDKTFTCCMSVFYVQSGAIVTINGITLQKGMQEGGGGIDNRGTLELNNSIVRHNYSAGGAGIHNYTGALALNSTTIQDNYADSSGAGIYNGSGNVTLNNSIVSANTVGTKGTGDGGGIYNMGKLTMTDVSLSGNTAGRYGGALINTKLGTLRVFNSTIGPANSAEQGGGVYAYGVIRVENSTLSGNSADFGGGLYYTSGDGVLSNVTITHNDAPDNTGLGGYGGGISNGSANITIRNSIIAMNTGVHMADCDAEIISMGYNIIGDTNGCDGLAKTDITDLDPLLSALADNGGPTQTHALLSTSPAIDAGHPSGCLDHTDSIFTSDQRGVIRPQDGDLDGTAHCDIGAYEFAWPPDIAVSDSVAPEDDLQISFPQTINNAKSPAAIVTLGNKGQLPLTVGNIGFNGIGSGEFTYDLEAGASPCYGLAIVVNPGQHCTLSIVFSPHWEGEKSAFLTISSDDPDEATVNIALTGSGVNPPDEAAPAGSGGCSMHAGAPFDPLLALMFILSVLFHRRRLGIS